LYDSVSSNKLDPEDWELVPLSYTGYLVISKGIV